MILLFPALFLGLMFLVGMVCLGVAGRSPRTFWPLLTAVSTTTGTLIAGGQTFFHEYLIGCLALGQWHYRKDCRTSAPQETRHHMLVFRAMCLYFAAEGARGALVLGSPQKVRWSVFYLVLAAVSVVAERSSGLLPPAEIVAQWIARAALLYFLVYIAAGLVAEFVFGISRYDLQPGHAYSTHSVWASSSYAVFPLALAMPSGIITCSNPRRRIRWLGWAAMFACVAATLYYDSRSGVFAVWLYLLLGFRRLGMRRAVVVGLFFVALVWLLTATLWPADRDLNTFLDDILTSGNAMWNTDVRQGGGRDFYRAVTIDAAFSTIGTDPLHLLFGYGLRVSGFVIGNAVEEFYSRYHPGTVLTNPDALGLEAFSDLLIATGLVGIGLLAVNGWYVLKIALFRSDCPYRLLMLAAVIVVHAWLFAINISDVPLFYIAVMPYGTILQLARSGSRYRSPAMAYAPVPKSAVPAVTSW